MNKITECSAPAPDRAEGSTHYLPVVNDGGIDPTIYVLDANLDTLNKATFAFDPESIRSMHEGDDGQGCTEVKPVPPFDLTPLTEYVAEISDAVKSADTTFTTSAGEQMVQKAIDIRYGVSGTSLANMAQSLEDLDALVGAVSIKTEEHANNAYTSLRDAITKTREILAKAVHYADASVPSNPYETTMKGLGEGVSTGLFAPVTIPWNVAGNLFDFIGGREFTFPPEAQTDIEAVISQSMNNVTASEQAVNDALSALNKAAEEVPTPIPGGGLTTSVSTNDKKLVDDLALPAPAPVAPISGGGGGAPISDVGTPEPSLQDKLNELMNSDPMAGMPSGGMPPGGGMPSMGGGSGGGMPGGDMGAPLSDLAGGLGDEELAKPLDDLTDDEEPEEPLEDLTEDEEKGTDEGLEDPGEIGADGELPEAEDPTEDPEEEVDEPLPEDGAAPVAAEPEVDPNSEEARTADVGNGRMVTFPTAALADLGEGLGTPGNENKTLRLQASELGFNIPPDGQDIGKQVPTSLLREGDVIVGAAGEGIFIGTDEVLMEGGKIVPLSEAATFSGENQGIFRLDEGGVAGGDATSGTPAAPAPETLTGVAQPVGDGSTSPMSATGPAPDATPTVSTPGEATEQAGTPGVPDDTAAAGLSGTDDTAAGAAFGETDNGAEGLNPDSAFAN